MNAPPSGPPREIGRKPFDLRDQEDFAALSFDRNPMHMDAVAARRLLTGQPVVHGIHVLVTALGLWERADGERARSLECTFNNPVNVNDEVVFSQKTPAADQVVIEASVHGLVCAKVRLGTTREALDEPAGGTGPAAPPPAAAAPFHPLAVPLDESPASHLERSWVVPVETSRVAQAMPAACAALGAPRVTGLLWLSYFVGMVCPGLNSIFASVHLKLDDDAHEAGELRFKVERYDERFRLFHVSFAGALSGRLTAFLRPEPQPQPAMADIARHVERDEFRGSRSLVIGASRGLGETAAKILAAGGGHVVMTYVQGLSDIRQVQADIERSGTGSCAIVAFDIGARDYTGIDFGALDAIYFFATPRIYRKKTGVFVRALFDEFVDFYVASLYELCVHLETLAVARPLRLYVPSSVFIDERPDGLAEYAMAKAAAEVLIQDINRHFRNVSILATRLPRLSTDQTSSVLNSATADNLGALLPVMRAMTGPPARPASA